MTDHEFAKVRASMGYWDPVFIRPLAVKRPVIMFDPPAAGQSTGETERTPSDSKLCHIETFPRPPEPRL